jgi:transposase
MRFYQPQTEFYCGVDLHARTMYLCIVDRQGKKLFHKGGRCDPKWFLRVIQPYRESLTVAAECVSNWYWLADLCGDEKIEFVLGHAQYMKAVHGGKAKNDRIDSEKIARLLQAGLLPMAYVYPRENRSLRDLLRRRLRFVRLRAELMTHIQILNQQSNLAELPRNAAKLKGQKAAVLNHFEQEDVRLSVEADLELITYYDKVIDNLEKHILSRAKGCHAKSLAVLRSVPGIGEILALTIAFEVDTVERFETRQQFCSYSRLVKCMRESAGKKQGTGGKKIGNPYLKWAFSEAAVYSARFSEGIRAYLARLERKYGQGKGKSLLAHKLGRTVYHMLKESMVFDEAKFLSC